MSSLEDFVVDKYKARAYPFFSTFLRTLADEDGIELNSKTLKSILLKAGITYPLSHNRRVNKPKRKIYEGVAPDFCWVR